VVGRSKLILFSGFLATVVFALIFGRQLRLSRDLPREAFNQPTVRLLTYASFMSANGPGKQIVTEFQKACNCKVEVVTAGDAGILLERLQLASGIPFDVVLGLDQLMLADARERFKWRTQSLDDSNWNKEPAALADGSFVPVDWSPMTFVYQTEEAAKKAVAVPKSFADLTSAKYRGQFALQDPHLSSPGLQFVNWVRAIVGAETASWFESFKPNVNSVSPSWSFSYGLLQKKKTRFVFSYLTSLAYHWGVDKDRSFQVLQFPEGHPIQVEFAAVPQECRQCDLAAKFVKHLLEPGSQALIMQKNFMLPVLKGLEQGSIYSELPRLAIVTTPLNKDLSDWDKAFPAK
jgi:thiamine transport system substrate-binding protein